MPEASEQVDVVMVRFYCETPFNGDICGLEIHPTGYVVATHPPRYQHTCPNGHRQMHDVSYPYIGHVPRQGAADDPDHPVAHT